MARLFTLAGDDRTSVELATLLMMTFVGVPCIYYGSEVGLQGGLDPDCRRAFPTESEWDVELLSRHKQLTRLRCLCRPLRLGWFQTLYADGDILVFARVFEEEVALVAVNVGSRSTEVLLEQDVLLWSLLDFIGTFTKDLWEGGAFWHVFREDARVPLAAVETLWAATARFDDLDSEDLVCKLFRFSLLLDLDLAQRRLQLHDVVRAYLLPADEKKHRALHRALVEAYRATCDDSWGRLADDGYVYANLPTTSSRQGGGTSFGHCSWTIPGSQPN